MNPSPADPAGPCGQSGNRGLSPSGAERRILVVDDDPLTRELTTLFLGREGFQTVAAEDGEAGWVCWKQTPFDLLITDNEMPRMTGLELIKRIRQAGGSTSVIVASGSLDLGTVQDYPALRITTILRKPFLMRDLIAAARRASGTGACDAQGPLSMAAPPIPAAPGAHA